MSHPIHHYHRRKRIHQKHEPYPHPQKWKRLLDKVIFIVGLLGPIMTIPQLVQIFAEKSAAGLSIVTWLSYTILNVFWLIYGIVHKEKPIIVTFIGWIVINAFIIFGIMLYG